MRMLQVMMLSALAAGGAAAWGGNPAVANQARVRGRTPIQGVTMPRGQRELAVNETTRQFSGTLIDAGCRNRSLLNLRLEPLPLSSTLAKAPVTINDQTSSGGVSAFGITVSPQTLDQERADVMQHQVPDMRTRQPAPTCAVTASTREFSLLLADGRLLSLDAGGSTFAWQGVQSTPEGRAMLNGYAAGFKPYATMKGYLQGSTLVVRGPMSVEAQMPLPAGRGSATRVKPR